jgi:uncharacterized protein (TIGR02145 family)
MNYRFFVLMIFVFTFLLSCGEDTTTPSKTAQITSISPAKGYIGDTITIYGLNFGISQDSSLALFNSTKVTDYLSWNDSKIKVKVPTGAISGKVTITVNNVKSNEVYFEVLLITEPAYYDSVKIGSQVWMLKNLNVDHYRNGDSIIEVREDEKWYNLSTGACCYYNNDTANGATYGKLYNWYAVNDPRGLAPAGWHIPTNAEWKELVNYFGSASVAGGKLKSTGTYEDGNGLWRSPNTDASNESGFTALPGDYRLNIGTFRTVGYYGAWWSSTDTTSSEAWGIFMYYDKSLLNNWYYNKNNGYSVRCIKDK